MSLTERIFNDVWRHLLCQGVRSTLGGTDKRPAIYGTDGRRDPVGLLIDAKYYEPKFEFRYPSHPLIVAAIEKSLGQSLDETCINLIVRLRQIHRQIEPCHWEAELRAAALEFGLTPPRMPRLIDKANYFFVRSVHEHWGYRLGYGQSAD